MKMFALVIGTAAAAVLTPVATVLDDAGYLKNEEGKRPTRSIGTVIKEHQQQLDEVMKEAG